jgi:hypothetical protein
MHTIQQLPCYRAPHNPSRTGQSSAEWNSNRTLMDRVRSMLSYSTLPISLWMEVLKAAVHILNRIPSKSMPKILYELWTGRKPTLNYLYVWD